METKSYLMGVFDGEGSISTYQQRGNWALTVSVVMASGPITQLFKETWGGNVHVRPKPTVGGLILHNWYLSASKAIPFLEYAAQHSLVKRRHAEIALELARSMARYAQPAARKGINLSAGQSVITEADRAERTRLVLELRALNGGRSRFDPEFRLPASALPTPTTPVVPPPTQEQLLELYVREGLSAEATGARLGLSKAVIIGHLHRYGIPRRGPTPESARKAWATRRAKR